MMQEIVVQAADQGVNWLDIGTAIFSVGTALGAAIWAVYAFRQESNQNRQQRKDDLRWRQAEAGKALNDEMQQDALAWAAMRMLDSHGQSFEDDEGNEHTVTQKDIDRALTADDADLSRQEKFIRDAFDNFFYYMAMFDHYIANKLVIAEDIAYPMEYYVGLLREHSGSVRIYLNKWKLTRSIEFLDGRYPNW